MTNHSNVYTVLMADDDPDDRLFAEKAFNELGFAGYLRFAQHGEELLHYLKQCINHNGRARFLLPDFILLDLNMPVKNGWEALKEIKKAPELCDIPVIIWTTTSDNKAKLRSIKMGADGFLTKPPGYTELLNSFQYLIEKYCNDQKTQSHMTDDKLAETS